ncbi:Hypothetical predicted protein [Olea europaea subsp. europaea]|uniref:Uncharacterized protein n=1 Tax=Olea europaea subsp. europaea TaxID=158383 RepID=A0A8S0US26_OLEEU|nr:Hypothetical predicted protein [Olea europaea subsp. europaea]
MKVVCYYGESRSRRYGPNVERPNRERDHRDIENEALRMEVQQFNSNWRIFKLGDERHQIRNLRKKIYMMMKKKVILSIKIIARGPIVLE